MKTAISIPDQLFQAAEGLAHRLGVSRSQLYAEAISEYTKSHKNQNVTDILNQVYQSESSSLEEDILSMQSQSIPKEDW